MRSARRLTAATLCGVVATAGPALACDCTYVEPCTITTNIADFVGAAEHTMCTVRGTSGSFSVAYSVTTVRGDRFRIENPFIAFTGWFINADPGIMVASADP